MSAFVCFSTFCCALVIIRPSQPPQLDITFHARSCLHEKVAAVAEGRWDRGYRQDTTVNDWRWFMMVFSRLSLSRSPGSNFRRVKSPRFFCYLADPCPWLSMKQVKPKTRNGKDNFWRAELAHIRGTSADQNLAMIKLIVICSCLWSF